MNVANHEPLSRLTIDANKKRRGRNTTTVVLLVVAGAVLAALILFGLSGRGEREPVPFNKAGQPAPAGPAPAPKPGEPVLTVSGYVIPRERIEISPKFLGTVRKINVKKGDVVKKDDILVELESGEYAARVIEALGRVNMSKANLANADLEFKRQEDLAKQNADSQRALDEAKRNRDWAASELEMVEGQLSVAKIFLDWCTIRAPIDGTILEKLVNPNELVVPQSFGSGRGPSTAFLAMADLNDLQVEIDLNEADTPKVHLNQVCRISPEAYPDKTYQGRVAEIAPEANRSKGTLQVKVQVEKPDPFLTPELTAKVDFLAD